MEIKAHNQDSFASRFGVATWRDPEGILDDGYEGRPYRACSYCGSIHPEDLMAALAAGAKLRGADWKYGWPHKFYVSEIPNPLVGQAIKIGSSYKDGVSTPMMGIAGPTTWAKWYNEHLTDLDPETFAKLAAMLKEHCGIEFSIDPEKGLVYRAPYAGYQK